jgi:peptidoglycan/xylan/chitin deacetylase (PgdA/CDA1 family)
LKWPREDRQGTLMTVRDAQDAVNGSSGSLEANSSRLFSLRAIREVMRRTVLSGSFLIMSTTAFAQAPSAQAPGLRAPGAPPITIDSTEEQIRNAVAAVRAGRKLTPKKWPNSARVVVCISVDVDNESLQRSNPLPVPLSNAEYGATTAIPRILDLLDREQIPATFFIPAMAAILHPEMIPAIQKSKRNEIGAHGWVHESWPAIADAAVEERVLNQSIEYLTRVTGKRPVGVRAPSSAFSLHSLDLILKAGFLYDSSLMAMDEVYEVNSHGRPTGLIEIPQSGNVLNDFRYYGGDTNGDLPSPEGLFQVYKAEFDMAYQEGTLVTIMVHPHVSGHRSRIATLEKFITYMKSRQGVWFATMEQVATYVKQNSGMAPQPASASR